MEVFHHVGCKEKKKSVERTTDTAVQAESLGVSIFVKVASELDRQQQSTRLHSDDTGV